MILLPSGVINDDNYIFFRKNILIIMKIFHKITTVLEATAVGGPFDTESNELPASPANEQNIIDYRC